MLEYIRTNAQSFGVKLAFGVIILVFVFWGVGSLRDPGGAGVLATVNGKPILAPDYEMALRQTEENIQRNMPNATKEQLRQLQIPRQVLQRLVVESLLQQEAARLDIAVSPLQMRRAIEQVSLFHNEQGRFDPEVYKRVLSTQRNSLARYETNLRKQLLEDALFTSVTAGAYVSPQEVRAFFHFAQEKRALEYLFFPASTVEPPAEDEVRAWYESNRVQFAIPPKVNVEYVLARPADLDVEKLRDTVDTLIEANIVGKTLAETAALYGLAVQRTGLISAFELEEALGLKEKDAQTLVNTPAGAPVDAALEAKDNGFVVARVVENTPAGTRDFDAVKPEIVKTLTAHKAQAEALRVAANARAQLDSPDTAKSFTNKIKKIDTIQRGESLPVLGRQPEMLQALFATDQGTWLPVAYEAVVDTVPGAVLVRVAGIALPEDSAWKPLEETLRSSLEQQRKNALFQTFIDVLRDNARVEIKNQAFLQQLEQF